MVDEIGPKVIVCIFNSKQKPHFRINLPIVSYLPIGQLLMDECLCRYIIQSMPKGLGHFNWTLKEFHKNRYFGHFVMLYSTINTQPKHVCVVFCFVLNAFKIIENKFLSDREKRVEIIPGFWSNNLPTYNIYFNNTKKHNAHQLDKLRTLCLLSQLKVSLLIVHSLRASLYHNLN